MAITTKFRGSGARAYVQLGNVLLSERNLPRASQAFYRAARSLVGSSSSWHKHKSPEQECIINHRYRFIYCPIPKVACSSIKKVMVQLSDLVDKDAIAKLPNDQFHTLIYHNLTLDAQYNEAEIFKIIQNNDYFKFAFVRNPWSRLVSAYLNKFVQVPVNKGQHCLPDNAKEVIEAVYRSQGLKPDFKVSITFEQFVNYIVNTSDDVLDGHWKPQYRFLENIQLDFVGKLENIVEDFNFLKEKLGINIDIPWSNKSQRDNSFNTVDLSIDNYSKAYPIELSYLESIPRYWNFYSSELAESVRSRYQKDISLFGYQFRN